MNIQLYKESAHMHKEQSLRYLKSMTSMCNDTINVFGKVRAIFSDLLSPG